MPNLTIGKGNTNAVAVNVMSVTESSFFNATADYIVFVTGNGTYTIDMTYDSTNIGSISRRLDYITNEQEDFEVVHQDGNTNTIRLKARGGEYIFLRVTAAGTGSDTHNVNVAVGAVKPSHNASGTRNQDIHFGRL